MSRYNIYNYLGAGSWPLHADCGEVDHAGEGGEHLDVADDLADGSSLVTINQSEES